MKISLYMTQVVGKTRGWTQFIAILGYLVSLVILITAGIVIYRTTHDATMSSSNGLRFTFAGALILNALIYLYPASKLWGFSTACQNFLDTRSDSALAHGLAEHRRFWKGWGILSLVMLGLNGVLFLIISLMGGAALLMGT